ncbi:ClbS/DfsB family four-helix bundle protein [Flavobacterium sp. 2]|uniref:ClbS/DfsB family four-helix bundle protein n=1 Tax=Flavobacterium sp. 2 TaxID=308053 RepID=UPI000C187CCC|nr:ClbS/DfsB family four-helix bundle protein [Flavobacterium sp. 2]PIF53635.1 hypothetical protein CLU99_4217 [Flavobacterium sp. 2]
MAVPVNKEELQNAIKINYNKLKKELLSIPHELTTVPNLEGHMKNTTMSINNLISYLNGWGELVLKWNTKKERNEIVDFPETGYKWNELGKLAQKFYNDYEKDDFNTLCTELDEITGRILFLIEQKTNTELYETAWYEKWTLGRMIQFNTSSPYNNARARIRKWKKENNIK